MQYRIRLFEVHTNITLCKNSEKQITYLHLNKQIMLHLTKGPSLKCYCMELWLDLFLNSHKIGLKLKLNSKDVPSNYIFKSPTRCQSLIGPPSKAVQGLLIGDPMSSKE